MILSPIEPFIGVHCETTTTGTLLNHLGLDLSEPMLFGLGEGLGYIYWNMKFMDSPFIGGRIKPLQITKNLAKNLNLHLDIKETRSIKKAWENVKYNLAEGHPVGLQLDSFYLKYFGVQVHFAAHFAAMYGYDEELAYLVDTKTNGGISKTKTSLKSLELARNEKGPMAAKNLCYTLKSTPNSEINLPEVIKGAISRNIQDYLNPPIKNFGYKGIFKTSTEIKKWFNSSQNVEEEFTLVAMIMEEGGTGGSIFRNIYSDFLAESYGITGIAELDKASSQFKDIALLWSEVTRLFVLAGKSKDITYINQASEILVNLSHEEHSAMSTLKAIQSY